MITRNLDLTGKRRGAVMSCDLGELDEFCGQFNTGGSAPDHRDAQGISSGEALQQARLNFAIEAQRLGPAIDHQTVLTHARCSEVIGLTANGQDQRVIGNIPFRKNMAAIDRQRAQVNLPRLSIKALEFPGLEVKMAITSLGDEVRLLLRDVAGSGGYGVEHGLPHISRLPVDE